MRLHRPALLAFSLAVPATAQLPVDHAAVFSSLFTAGEGILVVDVHGGGGVVAEIELPVPFHLPPFGVMDPVSGDFVVAGGHVDSQGKLLWVELDGLEIARSEVFVDFGSDAAPTHLAFGPNGDLFLTEGGSLIAVDRHTGVPTVWDTPGHALLGGIAVDVGGGRLYLAGQELDHVEIVEYDIAAGPGPGTPVAELPIALPFAGVYGFVYGGGSLYATSTKILPPAEVHLFAVELANGEVSELPLPPGEAFFLGYDEAHGTLHVVKAGEGEDYWLLDPSGGELTSVPGDLGFALGDGPEPNSMVDRTSVFPRTVDVGESFTFEAAAHGYPGEPAGLFVTRISGVATQPLPLGTGVCDSGGFLSVELGVPGGLLSAGDTFEVTAVRFDAETREVVRSRAVTVEVAD